MEIEAARGLWQRVLDSDDSYDFEKASTLEHVADSYMKTDPEVAEQYYRAVLAEHPTMNGTTHTVEISLAELLVERGDRASVDEAAALLESWIEQRDSPFPSVLFRLNLALIAVAELFGDQETVKRAARTALDLLPGVRCSPGTPTSVSCRLTVRRSSD